MEMKVRWLGRVAGLLWVTAVILVLLIVLGTFDPKPVGGWQRELPLSPQTIEAGTQSIFWLAQDTPAQNYSLRLMTAYQSGETDVLYGLVIGDDEAYWVTAVSPLGYTAIWEQQLPLTINHPPLTIQRFPFQTWPHVRPDTNEIWLDVVNGRATVRINRELLWQGEVTSAFGRIGLWGESFGGTAVIDFQSLQIFTGER